MDLRPDLHHTEKLSSLVCIKNEVDPAVLYPNVEAGALDSKGLDPEKLDSQAKENLLKLSKNGQDAVF